MKWSDKFSFMALANSEEEMQWHETFIAQVEKESIRGQVLNIVSFIDELLNAILIEIFPNKKHTLKLLEDFDSCLSTIMDKANVLHAANCLSANELESIKYLARIRNIFAHKWNLDNFDYDDFDQLNKKFTKKLKPYIPCFDFDANSNISIFMCVASRLVTDLLKKVRYQPKIES